jgi:hypothetical protein
MPKPQPPKPEKRSLASIVVGDRYRTDLGDLSDLIASIRTYGQQTPLVVTDRNELAAGERRLEAMRALRIREVDVYVVATVAEAAAALKADRAQTRCAKPMTLVEKVAQAQVFYVLHDRAFTALPPYQRPRKDRGLRGLDAIVADAIDMRGTRFRGVRFAYQVAMGFRPDGKPVTAAQRALGQAAIGLIEADSSVDRVVDDLRVQLADAGCETRPKPRRKRGDDDEVRPAQGSRRPRMALLDEVNSVVLRLGVALDAIDRVIKDDRWPAKKSQVAPSTRNDLQLARERLDALVKVFEPADNQKESTP